MNVVLLRPHSASFADLEVDRAGHDVARGKVLDRRRVALHEPLAGRVSEDPPLAARGLGQQDADAVDAGRMELEELHVLERQAATQDDGRAVAGQRVRVRGHPEDAPVPAGREEHGLGVEDVQLAGRQLVRDHAGDAVVHHEQVQDVEFVEELDVVLDALLIERLQDHVAGAVGGVGGPAHRALAVVARVAAEPSLVDAAVGRPVERQPPPLQVDHGVDRFLAHDLDRVLIREVIRAFHGVEGVPFPRVLFDVGERRAHAALRGAGVGARRVKLRDDGGPDVPTRLQGCSHPCAAGADDHGVVGVDRRHLTSPPTIAG